MVSPGAPVPACATVRRGSTTRVAAVHRNPCEPVEVLQAARRANSAIDSSWSGARLKSVPSARPVIARPCDGWQFGGRQAIERDRDLVAWRDKPGVARSCTKTDTA